MLDSWKLARAGALAVLAIAMLLVAGCDESGDDDGGLNPGGNDDVVIPASWAGIWKLEINPEMSAGLSTEGADEEMLIDIIYVCSGMEAEALFFDDDEDVLPTNMSSTGTWGDNAATVTCTADFVDGDCTRRTTVELSMTRSGATFSGTLTETDVYLGETCTATDEVETATINATLVRDSQPSCSTLNDTVPSSWEGDWSITETSVDCTTGNATADPESFDVSFCTGVLAVDLFYDDGVPQDNFELEGGFSDTSMQMFSVEEYEEEGGCFVVETDSWEITRNGDTISGTWEEVEYHAGGGECVTHTECESGTFNGTRTSTSSSSCE